MTVQPLLRYPGAKWRLASWLHQFIPHVPRVVDVYGGSGAFCLTLPYRPQHLIYNDISEDLYNLFCVIRHPEQCPQLCAALAATLWSRAEYRHVCAPNGMNTHSGDPVEDARRYLVRCWQGQKGDHAGRTGWRNKGTWARAHTYETWRQLPNRIAQVAACFQDAEIECVPALTLIARYATADTLLYCDPPYMRTTIHGARQRMYQHEMTIVDHGALLDALLHHPGPVMLSGYMTPLYRDRLAAWTCQTTQVYAESNARRIECVWLNPACVARRGYGPLFDQQEGV